MSLWHLMAREPLSRQSQVLPGCFVRSWRVQVGGRRDVVTPSLVTRRELDAASFCRRIRAVVLKPTCIRLVWVRQLRMELTAPTVCLAMNDRVGLGHDTAG